MVVFACVIIYIARLERLTTSVGRKGGAHQRGPRQSASGNPFAEEYDHAGPNWYRRSISTRPRDTLRPVLHGFLPWVIALLNCTSTAATRPSARSSAEPDHLHQHGCPVAPGRAVEEEAPRHRDHRSWSPIPSRRRPPVRADRPGRRRPTAAGGRTSRGSAWPQHRAGGWGHPQRPPEPAAEQRGDDGVMNDRTISVSNSRPSAIVVPI